MRLLHTSDWHIGKRFEETDLLAQQALFCDWLVDFVAAEKIDALLLAGDIFDRALPKADAIDLVDEVLNRISATGTAIVAISGNHDSAERLNFGSRFMSGAKVHLRAERPLLQDTGAPVTITRSSDGDSIEILPLPYIDPQRVLMPEGMQRRHDTALEEVIRHHRGSLVDVSRTIVMSHSFVTGGLESDSERPLTVGGTGMVPSSVFDGFGYVALGHLHRPQIVGADHIVYSGSPMSYSFSEEHQKSVRIIETDGAISSHTVDVNVGRKVATITDTLQNMLTSSKYEKHRDSFVRARLADTTLQLGIMDKLRQRFPYIISADQPAVTRQGALSLEEMRNAVPLSPAQIVTRYLDETFDELGEFESGFINQAVDFSLKGDY